MPQNQFHSDMAQVRSFAPIARSDATVLILGSIPGVKSLQAQRYYAHPRNCFWHIIENLFAASSRLNYADRIELLRENRIAVWDVLKQCTRRGSLDSSINISTAETQDFNTFYKSVPNINTVFFNGATAEKEYIKRVKPDLPERYRNIMYSRLPSTSPAMAALTWEQKLEYWKRIKDAVTSS